MSAQQFPLLDYCNEILLLIDPVTLTIHAANAAASRHLGFSPAELIGRSITDLECALSDVFYWKDARHGTAPELHDAEASYRCANGELLAASKTITRIAGEPGWLVIRAVPDDRLRLAEEALAEASARLGATLEATADGILLVNRAGAIVNMSRRFTQLWRIPVQLLLAHDDAAIYAHMAGLMRDPAVYRQRCAEIMPDGDDETKDILYLADGRVFERKSRPACHGKLIFGRVYSVADITDLEEHQQRLEHMAHYDALTGVPNRVLLADRMRQAMALARRRQRLLALVYLDLDGFKEINDAHGHDVGDQLLIGITQHLRNALREGDTLARLGGDEFVAVLTDFCDVSECVIVLTRLLQAASTSIKVDQLALQLTASLGVTLYPQDAGDADTLLRHADQAMYQAKQSGGNRYHLFDPVQDREVRSRRESLRHIELALENREFVLHYQPKVNMRTGAVIGVEALIRWQHPENGLVPPSGFLPLIEGNPLIARVGDWVIDAALEQLEAWQAQGLDLAVSVNIAAYHLQQNDFLSRLREKLAAHPNIRPGRLELELLETAALEGISRISQLMEGCRALGVHFSLDDFGTGYSSLTYLKRLPANVLKIDQSFVIDMLWDTEDMAIVEGVIVLAGAFRRDVIAEGVETTEHGELLLRLGCEFAQGYGIGRPMPADSVPGWVSAWRPAVAWNHPHNMPANRDELSLTYAEVDHRNWVKCLETSLEDVAIEPPSLDADESGFIGWYLSEVGRHYGHLPQFSTIAQLHREMRDLGSELLALRAAGRTGQARERFDELRVCRDELIALLHELALEARAR